MEGKTIFFCIAISQTDKRVRLKRLRRQMKIQPRRRQQRAQANRLNVLLARRTQKSQVFLNIVPVRISAGKKTVCCFAFLDQGSTTSLCDERLLKELDITGEKTSFTLSTLNNSAAQVGSKVDLMISSLSDSGNLRLKNVLSVNKLPVRPNQPLEHRGKACWPHLQKLKIPHSENQEVMLLIGVDTPEAFWIEDEIRGKPGEPYAIKTMLGWSLIGPATGRRMRYQPIL